MKEQTERADADPEHRERCRAKLDVLMQQQVDLGTAIDQLLDDIEAGRKYMKVYKQMKMYNDPATNPVLYAKIINEDRAHTHNEILGHGRRGHDRARGLFARKAVS